MKKKLAYYLSKEYEILNDILMQTKEILKSIDADDIEYAGRLLTGRGKNIERADRFQCAAAGVLDRAPDDSKETLALQERVTGILTIINELDNEISEKLSGGYAESKAGYKKVKESMKLKRSYSSNKRKTSPKRFDKKT